MLFCCVVDLFIGYVMVWSVLLFFIFVSVGFGLVMCWPSLACHGSVWQRLVCVVLFVIFCVLCLPLCSVVLF